jgi:hypothetical protein
MPRPADLVAALEIRAMPLEEAGEIIGTALAAGAATRAVLAHIAATQTSTNTSTSTSTSSNGSSSGGGSGSTTAVVAVAVTTAPEVCSAATTAAATAAAATAIGAMSARPCKHETVSLEMDQFQSSKYAALLDCLVGQRAFAGKVLVLGSYTHQSKSTEQCECAPKRRVVLSFCSFV